MGLGVKLYDINAALKDKDGIQDAALKVLSMWVKRQSSSQEAYLNLLIALKSAEMNELASYLKMWVTGIDDPSQITEERRLLKLLFLHLVHNVSLTTSNLVSKNVSFVSGSSCIESFLIWSRVFLFW